MHWADVLANELLERGNEHVLATGITPSGPIHVGNLREVLTTEAVHRAVLDAGHEATLLYIGDTYDPLRKVSPLLEDPDVNTADVPYDEHIGKPISAIACPCGEHESYAHHFLEPFLASLEELGVDPRIELAHELYEGGAYQESIELALENADEIKAILEEKSGRDLDDGWLPLNVLCQACGRLMGTTPTAYEHPNVAYTCGCGHEGEVDVREPGIGKLPWRVDWPARWSFLDVTFEAFGKDHASAGGSWDTAVPIARDVFGYEPPNHTVYEWLHVKGEGSMSSSAGTGIAAEDVLGVTPPEALRFFFMRYQPSKHIEFDAGLGLLDLVDEYDRTLEAFSEEGTSGEIKDVDRVLELSQPSSEMPEHPGQSVSMRHLANLVQIYEDTEEVLDSVRRSGHVDALSEQETDLLRLRIEHTRNWINSFAPENVRFSIPDEPPIEALDEDQRELLATWLGLLETVDWQADAIQNTVYDTKDKLDIGAGQVFRAAYTAILGRTRGPRLGPFLAGMQRDWVLDRLRAVTTP